MLLGILSDTHDRRDALERAVKMLRGQGAEFLLHCGDVGGPEMLTALSGSGAGSAFVFGNNDWQTDALRVRAAELGIQCCGGFGDLNLGGKRVALMHGDDFALKQQILDQQQFDYLLLGHTHLRQDLRIGRTRVINPGALFRAAAKSIATLDTTTDRLQFFVMNTEEPRSDGAKEDAKKKH